MTSASVGTWAKLCNGSLIVYTYIYTHGILAILAQGGSSSLGGQHTSTHTSKLLHRGMVEAIIHCMGKVPLELSNLNIKEILEGVAVC